MRQHLNLFEVVQKGFYVFIFFVPILAFSQKENNIWYFGNGAGIDFNSGIPVPLTNGAINTTEGCASIADTSGNLLFYTDGVTVYNKVHSIMVNGTGLLGGNSSTESAIIVPLPGSNTLYYIFTTPNQGGLDGLNYSIVDMSLQGGMGEVSSLNNLLHAPIGEKVCATHHSNGTDYWIVAHEFNTNAFYAFQLSSAGVNPVPVISNTGMIHTGYHGYLKFTPDASKIGLAVGETNGLELLDFDNSTGVVSNPITFPNTYIYPYGVEFSPDNSKFYVAQSGVGGPFYNDLWEYDPLLNTWLQKAPLPTQGRDDGAAFSINGKGYYGFGQIGGTQSVSDFWEYTPDTSCVSLLAAFIAVNHVCPGTCTNFTNLSVNASSYLWNFGGANPATSVDANPQNICYSNPGSYSVSLIAVNANDTDTLTLNNYITVYPFPSPQGISQNGDTLFANPGALSYQWYHGVNIIPGATDYFYVATSGGDFNVVTTDINGCEVEAAIFDVVAGIQAADRDEQLSIFPNPVTDKMEVISPLFHEGKSTLEIFSSKGNLVYTVTLEPGHMKNKAIIDVSQFASGLYWIKVAGRSKTITTKFLITNSR